MYSLQTVLGVMFTATELSVEAVVVVVALVVSFAAYDLCVQRKMAVVLQHSARSDAIVSSLFPADFRERLPVPGNNNNNNNKKSFGGKILGRKLSSRMLLTDFIGESDNDSQNAEESEEDNAPIANLYPETTIMLLDLVGFTAWSSAREPSAVFLLLESIFSAFDELAKHRRVFKVETVGGTS